ncbi:MAG TPA: response regulator [Thiothrix sp.]|nr:response regulator [Thiothrix sp.]
MPHILIVDDSPTETYVLRSIFEKQGYQVSEACNGEEGIAVAEVQKPDLIIMDVVMPGVNGFQATRELGQNSKTSNIPVIVYSSKDQVTDRMWAMRQGAVAYMVKPMHKDKLLSVVEKHLQRCVG